MKKALSIAALISLALLFSNNSVWAAAQNGIASAPGPEALFLFGIGLIGLTAIGRFKIKN